MVYFEQNIKKNRSSKNRLLFLFLFLVLCLVILTGLRIQKKAEQAIIDTFYISKEYSQDRVKIKKPDLIENKGLYLTSWTAGSNKSIDHFIELLEKTELNTLIIDIKDYSGKIAYDSKIPLVNELKIEEIRIKNIKDLIKKLHDHDIYVIARQTVFQDPELSSKKPEWAVKNSATGRIWRDYKGLGWMDPACREVWDYNIAIAKEAVSLGFDEINFDYIRFPSDGRVSLMQFPVWDGQKEKHEVIKSFMQYVHEKLEDEPAHLSVDLFGLTTVRQDDMNIGQLIEDFGPFVQYICPMVYPSHYPIGFMGFSNPADHPYEIIFDGIKKANERLAQVPNNQAKLRPWIQDFDMGAQYTSSMIRKQIKANNDAQGFGWLVWNARNVYTEWAFEEK